MLEFEKEKGFFVLTNKLTGAIKTIDVPFDWNRADALMKKAERIYAALKDETGNTIPGACEDITVCENCSLRHICTAPHELPTAEIDDGELEQLIDLKAELKPSVDAYKKADDEIKKCLGDREKVIAGKYLVTAKIINKQEYIVKARQERRISISRL